MAEMATTGGSKDPSREELLSNISAMQKLAKAQSTARDLKERAKKVANPQERERMFREAHDKEIEANGYSKWARRMESGTWQGMFGGGGIGAGVGVGLGTVVGTVVGSVGSLVTLPLGGLVGAGVGAWHGPWIKVGDQQKRFEDATPEEVAAALEEGRNAAQEPSIDNRTGHSPTVRDQDTAAPVQRKKPRKIEIRSQKDQELGQTDSVQPRRPRKLDQRSMSKDIPGSRKSEKQVTDSGYEEDG